MTWTRWDTEAPHSDVVGYLAEALHVRQAEAYGLYNACCQGFAKHRADGLVSEVPDTSIERWAMWEGKKGRFAAAFRARCVSEGGGKDPAGTIRGWWRQAALLTKQAKDAQRPPSHRRDHPDGSREEISGEPARESGGNPRGNSDGDGGRRTEDVDETISSILPARLLTKLVGHPARYAITGFLDGLPPGQTLEAWGMCLNGCLEGLGTEQGRKASVDELAAACNDYRSTPPASWGIPHFRSFVDRIVAKRFRPQRRSQGKTAAAVSAAATWVGSKGGEKEPAA